MKYSSCTIAFCFLLLSAVNAESFRAYGIGGNEEFSKANLIINKENYTVIPFSNLDIKKNDVNKSGDYVILLGELNKYKLPQIKLSSNYKNEEITLKVFKKNHNGNLIDLNTNISVFTNNIYNKFSINID